MTARTALALPVLMLGLLGTPSWAQTQPALTRAFDTLAKHAAPEAYQGVGVDADHFYAVTDRAIGKYDKKSGQLVGRWEGPKDGPIIHLDSAVAVEGKLYAAHSNYPALPMTSSVEIWDTAAMQHVGTHSFGIQWGSLTWIDRHDGFWWAVFANYSRVFGPMPVPYGNTYWTTLVKFDDSWQWQEAWTFPEKVLKRAEPMSISGGSWGPDGLLYCTGHDHPEVYVLRLPKAGSVLELIESVPLENTGQGIAWDRSAPGILYAIQRSSKQVVVSRMLR